MIYHTIRNWIRSLWEQILTFKRSSYLWKGTKLKRIIAGSSSLPFMCVTFSAFWRYAIVWLPFFQRPKRLNKASSWYMFIMRGSRKFCQRGPNLITFFFFFFFFGDGIEDPNTALNGPSSARQRNAIFIGPPAKRHGVSLAGRWWQNIKCWLGRFVIFQEIRTSITRKPYNFVIFQRGSGPPVPPSGSAHVHVAEQACLNATWSNIELRSQVFSGTWLNWDFAWLSL